MAPNLSITQRPDTFPMFSLTKKTFFYKFFPTKDEENEAMFNGMPFRTRRCLLEIRDVTPTLTLNPMVSPWKIVKTMSLEEISSGTVILSESDTLQHVFRYWTMEKCYRVLRGHKVNVLVYDIKADGRPSVHGLRDGSTTFEKRLDNWYVLRLNMYLVHNMPFCPGGMISLFWNAMMNAFYIKLSLPF